MSAAASTSRTVSCPTCKGPSRFVPANRWRPFCSERCRAIDLGAWASESYRVEADSPAAEDDDRAAPDASEPH